MFFKKLTKLNWFNSTVIIFFLALFFSKCFAEQVAAPKFSHDSGKYNSPISITMSCEISDAQIYFTTDGTMPDQNAQLFTGTAVICWQHASGDSVAFSGDNDPDVEDENVPLVNRSLLLKAIAVKEGMEDSEIIQAEYVIDLVDATFDIDYDIPPAAGGTKHKLDIYQPIGKKDTPVLLFIHGGAWRQGDKNIYMELGNTLAGYYQMTTVLANYQLSTDPWFAVHPTHVEDVAKAFKWVCENIAAYGGDPENINLFGQSAGAHLASLLVTDTNYSNNLSLTTDQIKSVVAMSGAYDLYDLVEYPNNPLGLTAFEVLEYKTLCMNAFGGWDQNLLDSASPEKFLKSNQMPFRIIALNESDTFKDMPGFGQQARNFYSAIVGLNGPSVDLKLINETDIPDYILAVDFPADYDGHYEEIYSINSLSWGSRSAKLVAEFIQTVPTQPELVSPQNEEIGVATDPLLNWAEVQNSMYYFLQVSTDESYSGAELMVNSPVAENYYQLSNLQAGKQYCWRVKSINALGESEWSLVKNFITSGATDVRQNEIAVPIKLTLNCYPNPFNSCVKLNIKSFAASSEENCIVQIFDILGRRVFETVLVLHNGNNQISWQPDFLPGGIYLVRINSENQNLLKKLTYLK